MLIGFMTLAAQTSGSLSFSGVKLTPEMVEQIHNGNRSFRNVSFNFSAMPYNLPDSTDLADPQTGPFNEDIPWVKDFSRHVNNPDGDTLYISWSEPTHFTISQPDPDNPLRLLFQPIPANWYGTELVYLYLSNQPFGRFDRNVDLASVRLNVTPVDDNPIWVGMPPNNYFYTTENTPLTVDFREYIRCVDSPDSTDFDLAVINDGSQPHLVIVSQSPGEEGYLVTFTPQDNFNGTVPFMLIAVDRFSQAVSVVYISVIVEAVNTAPQIVGYSPPELDLYVNQGASVNFDVDAEDNDNTNLTYTWTLSWTQNGETTSQNVTVLPERDYLTYTFTAAGVFSLNCRVSDGVDSDDHLWQIHVSPPGPAIDPAGGSYDHEIAISITPAAGYGGAQIYYTLDGSDPTLGSQPYTGPVTISPVPNQENSLTLKAVFAFEDFPLSQVSSQDYLITGTVSDVAFNPAGGLYFEPANVQLSCANPAAEIYFTLDGSEPQPGNPGTSLYLSPIYVAAETDQTIKAKATRSGWQDSNTVQQDYSVTGSVSIASHLMNPPNLPSGQYYSIYQGEHLGVTIDNLSLYPLGATLYYTLDNTEPGPDNPSASIYTAGLEISLYNPAWIKVKAHFPDWAPSQTFGYYYDIRLRTQILPFANGTVFNPAPGISTVPLSVSISTSTSPGGALIYYTTDGSDPVPNAGLVYSVPIQVSATTTIKAIAKYQDLDASEIYAGVFEITGTVDAPAFDPAPGSYIDPVQLSLSTVLDGTEIHYTVDGSLPDESSFLYGTPLSLTAGTHQIRAKAYKPNWEASPLSEGIYNIRLLPMPEFSVAAGLYFDPIVVYLSVPTVADVQIYYTLDGTDPGPGSLLYDTGTGIQIGLQTAVTIRAMAAKTGWQDSPVSERSYQVTGTVATPAFLPDGGEFPAPPTVEITTATPGATIRYTLDGQDPTAANGEEYASPFTISGTAVLKAKAFLTDWRSSELHSALYIIYGTIADPVFNPGAGTYTHPISVELSANPADAGIYYTTDGSEPDQASGTLYLTGSPVYISSDTLLRARAYKTGWNASQAVSSQYYITGTVAVPVFSPPEGQYAVQQLVTLSTATPGASIRYTVDGTTPTAANGSDYIGPITVGASKTIKAFAFLAGWEDSPVASASYVINGPVGTPVISPPAGYYNSTQTVSISAYPSFAAIRYTLDGTTPSAVNGILYTAPFLVDQHAVVKAYAFQEHWLDSAVAQVEYFFVTSNPVFSIPSGIYLYPQTVSMASATPGTNIRYTLDGSDPSPVSGTVYSSPVTVSTTTTIKAIAYRDGWITSQIVTYTYVINGPVSNPVFSHPAGDYSAPFNVQISAFPSNATIYYTTDGSEPSETNGTVYAAAVPITANRVLKAKAYLANWLPSNVSTVGYNLVVGTVSFNPPGGAYTAAQSVSLASPTPGSAIYYSLDGSAPTDVAGNLYTAPIEIDTDTTVRARAYLANWTPSSITQAYYDINIPLPVVDTPQILPASGVYTSVQTVTIFCATPEANIYYTTNGNEPTQLSGLLYTGAFQISENTLVRARGFKAGYEPSFIATAQYIISIPIETVGTPSFSPPAGIYNNPIEVAINTSTPGAAIRFTVDNTEPTETVGSLYAGPFSITETATVKAIAYKTGMYTSQIANSSYVINIIIPEVAAPVFSLPSGTYQSAIDVSISTTTSESYIRYTTDGTNPSSTEGILYAGPIHLNEDSQHFIKAIACRDGWTPSSVVSATYLVTGTVSDVQFSLPGGVYAESQVLSLSTLTVNAEIHYTTDGTEPDGASPVYTAPLPLPLNTSITVKARAYRQDWIPSAVTQNTYTITGTVTISAPVFTPESGTYQAGQFIEIATPAPANATVRYTTDGTEPNGDSPIYLAPIPVPLNTSLTIKARAFLADWIASPIYSASYNVTGQVILPAALFSPIAGVYQTAQLVSLSPAELPAEAILRYTLDGSEPSDGSPAYISPISLALNSNTTIKVKGYRTDWLPSETASATYQITGQVVFNSPVFSPAPGVFTTEQQITVNGTFPTDATVRYTTDGSEPSISSTQYSGPISLPLNSTITLKVKAFKDNWTSSVTQTGVFTVTGTVSIASPVFNPEPGTYSLPQSVTINTTTIPAGGLLRYTLDGTDPTESSPVYSTPIQVQYTQSVVIKVRAYLANWAPSLVYTAAYTVTGQVSINEPVFSPAAGTYQSAQLVTISTITTPLGGLVRYTLDGTEPTASSPQYTGAISLGLNTNTTIKARAFLASWAPSQTYSATYLITGTATIPAPVFTPAAGTYTAAQTVAISSPVPANATIRYTTDGTDPTAVSPVYSGPIAVPLNTVMTLKAKAFLADWIASPVYSASYNVTGQVILPASLFTPAAGVYQTSQTVTFSPAELPADAILRYTLDGSEPSQNSSAYVSPISLPLNSITTIKVKGYRTDWLPSETASATYQITGQVAFNTPVFSPAPGVYTTAQQITVNGTVPTDAIIRYTTDGTEPTVSSAQYTTPISLPLNSTLTLKVKAFKTNWTPSATQTGSYTTTGSLSIALPVFVPPAGTYTEAQSVVINTTTLPAGGTVRYTTDGSDPTDSSPVYATPISIPLNSSMTVKARAYLANWAPSPVYTATYTVTGQVSINDPVFSPVSGTYQNAQLVTVSTITTPLGGVVRYTLDGTEPTASSPQYTGAISLGLNTSTTIKARAFLASWAPSQTYSATYLITGTVTIPAPVFSPIAGTYTSAQSVTIANPIPAGATVRFTTDGTDPTITSAVYSVPIAIPLNTAMTVKARAFLTDWNSSPVYSASYNVTGQVILPASLFTPAAGVYQTSQTVTLSPAELPADAILRYTLDGSEPSQNSPAYVSPISLPLNSITTIKVKGYRTDWLPSETASATYQITGQVAFNTPVFSPAPGVYTTAQQITVNGTVPTDAIIRYTTDGTEPTVSSAQYTTPISLPLNSTLTLKVKAFKTNWTPSATQTGSYTTTGSLSIALPVFVPPAGTYTEAQSVVINTTTLPAGGTVRYTTDGSDPTDSSPVYATPISIPLNSSMTVKARAYLANWAPSPVYTATYTVTGQVSINDPVFSPVSGTYQNAQLVTVSTITTPLGGVVRYTLDGTEPTASSPQYTGAISLGLNTSTTIKARAFLASWAPSQTYSATYLITGTVTIPAPVFTPAAGTYTAAQTVAISSPVPANATIRYTTDGTDPTAVSPVYSGPIAVPLNTVMTLKAKAFLADWIASPVYSASYNVTGQVILPAALFSPAAGVYQTAQTVTLSPAQLPADATLRYTSDGSEPSQNSPAYVSPINLPLNSNTTIKVKGYRTDWLPSETASATYQITGQVAFNAPVFSPAPGVYTAAQLITVNGTVPADATVRYTTDGSEPTASSTQYTVPISLPLNSTLTLKVKAFKTNWTPSATQTGSYTTTGSLSIVLPVFDPPAGTYTEAQSVIINTTTLPAGGTVRYTTNGSDPTSSSPIYTTPISLPQNSSLTIKARAYLTNWAPSPVYTASYAITGQVSINDPVFSPPAGTYSTAQLVTLNPLTTPLGAVVRYTLDGSEPTESSQQYTGAISLALNTATTIKAKAFLANWAPSQTYSADYQITGSVTIPAPVFTPVEGTYTSAQSVVIGTPDPSTATVRYTTDGTDPTESSPAYSGPIGIPLNTILTVKARAFLAGWTSSPVYSASYTVTGQVILPTLLFSPLPGVYQTAQSVTLFPAELPVEATLRYTLDGSEPSQNSPAYVNPISLSLNSNITIKVKGYSAGWIPSETATATYLVTGQAQIAEPVFDPAPGIYSNDLFVSINADTYPADALIRYTTDGSEPNEGSNQYTVPLSLPANNYSITLKVKAFKEYWTPSQTYAGNYTMTGQALILGQVFTPEPGLYQTAQTVTLSTQTYPTEAVVRFTLDGSEPTAASPIYSVPIEVPLNSAVTIKTRAFAQDWAPSLLYSAGYTVTGTVAIPDPVFTPPAGTYNADQYLVLNSQTTPLGATLHYTLDGSEPTESSPAYSQPVLLAGPGQYTVKVRAYKEDWLPSVIHMAEYDITGQIELLAPYFAPAPGVYTAPQNVTPSGGTLPAGAVIRYTNDGSEPTEASPSFTDPVSIGLNTQGFTLKIRAYLEGWVPSAVVTGVYTVTGQVQLAQAIFTPEPGIYLTPQGIELAPPALPATAILRYTLDGAEPTEGSPAYSSPINLAADTQTTIKVKGFAPNWLPSETVSGAYHITGTVATPQFSPPGGIFGNAIAVEITTATPGAGIRYTTDGSDPTPESSLYTEPVPVLEFSLNLNLKARAYKDGWQSSFVQSAYYTVLPLPVEVTASSYSGFIRVLWSLPAAAKELQGFNVYRRNAGGTVFTKLNSTLVNDQIGSYYYYDDHDVQPDVSYEYYVKAVYNGVESPGSAAVIELYQPQNPPPDLQISDLSLAYPNPAIKQVALKIDLIGNENAPVQITVQIFDFAGKQVRELTANTTVSRGTELNWDLKNSSGGKVARGTYFARISASDGAKRSEKVIKIAVK